MEKIKEQLLQLASEKEPDITLLCALACKIKVPTSSLVSEVFLPFFEKVTTYSYEIQVELSKVYALHGCKKQDNYWLKKTSFIPVVANYWLQSWLMIKPQEAMANATCYELKNALHNIKCNTRQQLEELINNLIVEDHTFDTQLIHLLKNGIAEGKLSYSLVSNVLKYLMQSPYYDIVAEICGILQQHFYVFSSPPEVSLRILMQRGEEYEVLALHTLGIWGENKLFREVLEGESWQLASKRIVLPLIELDAEVIKYTVNYLEKYPTYSADWVDVLLKGAYQGIHVSKGDIKKVVRHYFEYPFITATELVDLVDKKDKETLFLHGKEYTGDDIEKKIKLLEALNMPSAQEEIVRQIQQTIHKPTLRLLLDAVAELKLVEAEPYVLELLSYHPDICLKTLYYIGGEKTVDYLKKELSFNTSVKENIPSYEKEALALLASLLPHQGEIISYLQTHRLPHVQIENLRTVSVENETFLLEVLASKEIENVLYAIEKLGELGTIKALEPVIKQIGKMHEAAHFPNPAWQAAQKIANRAYDTYQLKTKKNKRQTVVHNVLAEILLKQFEQPLSEVHTHVYLNCLSEVVSSELSAEKIAVLGSSKNPHIVKFYVSFLVGIEGEKSVGYIKQYLHPTQDIYTLRQAIVALTALDETMLEEWVCPLLWHTNMNIKKTAADYLCKHGTIKSVQKMYQLFQRNDNRGLREKLEYGLRNILGEAYHFFLLNSCLPCEVPWQRELMFTTLENDLQIGEQHYISFPQLYTIVPLEKEGEEQEKYILNWEKVRKRTREDVLLWKKEENPLDKIEEAVTNASDVFVLDIIASTLREMEVVSVSDGVEMFLTTEEARLATIKNGNNTYLWETILLDPESEQIEYENLVNYKAEDKKNAFFLHFVWHYGIEKMLTYLVEKKQNSLLKKQVLDNRPTNPKCFLCLKKLFEKLNEANQTESLLSEIESAMSVSFWVNKEQQTLELFTQKTVSRKIEALAYYTIQQQSVLKEELLKLYANSSWKQRNELLRNIKEIKDHPALINLSFASYLEGKELPFFNRVSLSEKQLSQLESSEEAIEIATHRTYHLPLHTDDFIKAFVEEIFSNQEMDEDMLNSFRKLSTERKWNILKEDINKEKWYLFSLFDHFEAINTAIRQCFLSASSEGKMKLITHLTDKNREVYFPGFHVQLLAFLKKTNELLPVWQLLFNLQTDKEAEKIIGDEFIKEYKGYASSTKEGILSHFVKNGLPEMIIEQETLYKLVPTNEKEEILLFQLKLKTIDYQKEQAAQNAFLWIRELAEMDEELARLSLRNVNEQEITVEEHVKLLDKCYAIAKIEREVTIQIAHILSQEHLALHFLSKEGRKRFVHRIEKLMLEGVVGEKKKVLKNLVDDASVEVKNLLLNLLGEEKKTDIDALCLRLLKKVTVREAYLEICFQLLQTKKENLYQSVIRTLAYARYMDAIPLFVKLLFHKKERIAKTAKDALRVMGSEAVSALTKERNKVRPDKRMYLSELLEEIEGKDVSLDMELQ